MRRRGVPWLCVPLLAAALVHNGRDAFQVLVDGEWRTIPGSVPAKGSFRKVVQTEDGTIGGLTYWDTRAIFLGREARRDKAGAP